MKTTDKLTAKEMLLVGIAFNLLALVAGYNESNVLFILLLNAIGIFLMIVAILRIGKD